MKQDVYERLTRRFPVDDEEQDVYDRAMESYATATRHAKARISTDTFEALSDEGHEGHGELQDALASLVWYYAMPRLNLRISARGGFVRATGWDQSRKELMSAQEMAAYRPQLMQEANRILDSYRVGDELWHV